METPIAYTQNESQLIAVITPNLPEGVPLERVALASLAQVFAQWVGAGRPDEEFGKAAAHILSTPEYEDLIEGALVKCGYGRRSDGGWQYGHPHTPAKEQREAKAQAEKIAAEHLAGHGQAGKPDEAGDYRNPEGTTPDAIEQETDDDEADEKDDEAEKSTPDRAHRGGPKSGRGKRAGASPVDTSETQA